MDGMSFEAYLHMKPRCLALTIGLTCKLALTLAAFSQPEALLPPPQDQGLPYTRSAAEVALEKIREGSRFFPGFVTGMRGGSASVWMTRICCAPKLYQRTAWYMCRVRSTLWWG